MLSSSKRPRGACFLPIPPIPCSAMRHRAAAKTSLRSPFVLPLPLPPAAASRPRHALQRHVVCAVANPPLARESSSGEDVADTTPSNTSGSSAEGEEGEGAQARGAPRQRRKLSAETKRKIAFAMLGQKKSDEMRAKVSQKLKGRVPWNKGKKLSAETRARMSEARFGRVPWNKGRSLSQKHRHNIAAGGSGVGRIDSAMSRARRRMARRRPGDAIVAGGGPSGVANGAYPLVETTDINTYVTLRRELRVWSDQFSELNSRRPSLADVRRNAPPEIIRQFERYVAMRDRIRGLAADVYGTINPSTVPVVSPKVTTSAPQNNNAGSVVQYTSNGNPRLVRKKTEVEIAGDVAPVDGGDMGATEGIESMEPVEGIVGSGSESVVGGGESTDSTWGQWDVYDQPMRGDYSSGFQVTETLGPEKEKQTAKKRDQLSPNDYRAIGKYRLIESADIHRYVQLRKKLLTWSASYKKTYGHTPSLSDVEARGYPRMYRRFCEYVNTRDHMDGLFKEVVGAEVGDVEQIKKMSKAGRKLVDQLRPKSPPSNSVDPNVADQEAHTERLKNRSPPSEWAK